MAKGFTVTFSGVLDVKEKLADYNGEIRELAKDTLRKSAEKGRKKAGRKAPRGRTGRLRASIFVRYGRSRASSGGRLQAGDFGISQRFGYALGANARDDKGRGYAFWTEYGRGSKPWLKPIWRTETRYVRRLMRRGTRELIQRLGQLRRTPRRRRR